MENAERRVGHACTGGPPWPPLVRNAALLRRGAATEDRSYRSIVLAIGFAVAWMLLTCCPSAFALNPSLDISQYAHTSWKIRDGFSKGRTGSIAQTPDGYLWIGTDKGLASWNGNRLTQYQEFAGQAIFALLEDREGTVWVGTYSFNSFPAGRLCAIHNGSIQCQGEDGAFGRGVFNLYEDKRGNLWSQGQSGLWRWKPGPPELLPITGLSTSRGILGEEPNGAL